jgi:hypothetical protein
MIASLGVVLWRRSYEFRPNACHSAAAATVFTITKDEGIIMTSTAISAPTTTAGGNR